MAKKKTPPQDKPVRVQFKPGATSQEILTGIKSAQDRWAKEHPDLAHKLYPTVWDESGNRIPK